MKAGVGWIRQIFNIENIEIGGMHEGGEGLSARRPESSPPNTLSQSHALFSSTTNDDSVEIEIQMHRFIGSFVFHTLSKGAEGGAALRGQTRWYGALGGHSGGLGDMLRCCLCTDLPTRYVGVPLASMRTRSWIEKSPS